LSLLWFFANFLQKKNPVFSCNYLRKIVTWFSKTHILILIALKFSFPTFEKNNRGFDFLKQNIDALALSLSIYLSLYMYVCTPICVCKSWGLPDWSSFPLVLEYCIFDCLNNLLCMYTFVCKFDCVGRSVCICAYGSVFQPGFCGTHRIR